MKTSLLGQKIGYVRKKLRITQKLIFLSKFEKGKLHRKTLNRGNNFFGQTSKMGQILTKNFFSLQNEPNRAKLRFSGVLKHFQGN